VVVVDILLVVVTLGRGAVTFWSRVPKARPAGRTYMEVGGVVVADAEWTDYAQRTVDGSVVIEQFGGDEDETRIWRDASGSLVCQKGQDEVVPMFRYSEVMADPNTEAVSGSAVFLQRLVTGGMPMEMALAITMRLYSRVPHSREFPAEVTTRILEQWRTQT
jgi:hypothetical protein